MTQTRYMKSFPSENLAIEDSIRNTRAHAKGDREVFCVIEGPDDDWTVCDLRTAIETDMPYSWYA